jgi:gamma-glutamyltranspeptidase/glutathione hydrolase
MRGAIAAGHPLTAATGAKVLRAGGNAVDACVAAAFVSWVCESMLTGPGGGGFMLVHQAAGGRTRLLDFFVAVPREPSQEQELLALAVDFDGDTQQVFNTGPAAVAVPGTPLGLEAAHRGFGSLPWGELVAPAVRLAREGVELTPTQAYLHRILDPLLRHSPEGEALYGPVRPLEEGERFAAPELAATLEQIAAEGAGVLYRGELAERICAHVPLTPGDLASYEVIEREPLAASYHGREFRSNPPPSSGGPLIALGLAALGDQPPTPLAVARAMEAQEAARAGAGGTTHISVVDTRGDAASLSASLGSGSGVVVPGTGIHLNNMLGEADLVASARPGERLTSMMAPSLVLEAGRPRLVVGSAGSARLRGAILQVVANAIGGGLGVREAVDAPRVHLDGSVVHCEDPAAADELEAAGYEVVRWRERNLFFGGVNAVEFRADGRLAAAGDPRRGGHAVVVE